MIIKVVPKLNKILKERGMKQIELSEMTGLPQGSISRFDKTNRHDDTNLFIIAQALNLNIEDLFVAYRENIGNIEEPRKINLQVKHEIYEELQQLANQNNQSLYDYIIDVLTTHANEKKPRLQ